MGTTAGVMAHPGVTWLPSGIGPADAARVAVVRQPITYEPAVVRSSIEKGLDHLGLTWRQVVRPADHVLLKPNLIRQARSNRPSEWEQIITHGSVIAAVAEGIAAALEGVGRITIADAPQTDSDFEEIQETLHLRDLANQLLRTHPGLNVSVLDLRREVWETRRGVVLGRRALPGDPAGYTLVDLGEASCFAGRQARYYGADYDTGQTASHHREGRHEYLLSRTAMDADVFVNLPKLKTHKKVGLTLSLKNLVGINGDKNYLPHFTMGTPDQGGDEFPSSGVGYKLQSAIIRSFKAAARWSGPAVRLWGPMAKGLGSRAFGDTGAVVRSGNWHGNDTTWRMVLDLNKILFHFDGAGRPREAPRRYVSVVDGIVAGEGNGPMEADSIPCGVVLVGTSPVAVDLVGSMLMGFDWERIPMIREAFALGRLPLASFEPTAVIPVPALGTPFRFRPHFGWAGHIELPPERISASVGTA